MKGEKPSPVEAEEELPLPESGKNFLVERRDQMREHASETQKKVSEIQGAKYETSLLKLMERTDDNPEIVNSLNEMLDALSHQATYGDSDKGLSGARQKELAEFMQEAAKALRWRVGGGNRNAAPEARPDFSKWQG